MNKPKVTISWSGGKDAAFALHKILLSKEYEVVSLHTIIGQETKRVGLHGVREELIEQQAEMLGIPLIKLYLEKSEDHAAYEKLMKEFYAQCVKDGVDCVAFGDIFLEDLRDYREEMLKGTGLSSIYPIWKTDTKMLLTELLAANFKTVVCSANGKYFAVHELGHTIDEAFTQNLLPGVDPCGENGEFHTFVYDGPIFKSPVLFKRDKIVSQEFHYQKMKEDGSIEPLRTTYWFQELLPLMAS